MMIAYQHDESDLHAGGTPGRQVWVVEAPVTFRIAVPAGTSAEDAERIAGVYLENVRQDWLDEPEGDAPYLLNLKVGS
jgi:hypothetical protein